MDREMELQKTKEIMEMDKTMVGFMKEDVMDILKLIISVGTVFLIVSDAYRNNYAASGKFLGLEFNINPQH